MEETGMTNRQFDGVLRLLVDDVRDAITLADAGHMEKVKVKLIKIETTMQSMIED